MQKFSLMTINKFLKVLIATSTYIIYSKQWFVFCYVLRQYKANCVEEMHQMIRGGREDSGEEELEEPDASLQISSMFHPRFLGSDSFG